MSTDRLAVNLAARPQVFHRATLAAVAYPALTWTVAFGILLLRRPETLTVPQFVNEDGARFYVDALLGVPWWQPYAGYLQLVPRAVMSFVALFPTAIAPLVANSMDLAIHAAIAAYLAGPALERVVPSRDFRLAIAALFILLPGVDETTGHIYDVQWNLAVFLVATSLAARIGPAGRIGVTAASLSGPFSLFFAPLHWLRARRTGDWLTAALVTVGGAAQAIALLTAGRPDGQHPGLELAGQVLVLRAGVQAFIGASAMNAWFEAGIPFVVGLAAAAVAGLLIVVVARRLPRLAVLTILYAGAVIVVPGVLLSIDEPGNLLSGWAAARYFVLWWFAIGLLVLAAAARRYPAGILLGVVLALAIVNDFKLVVPADEAWPSTNACIGGPAPCVVPIPWSWAIYWPGR